MDDLIRRQDAIDAVKGRFSMPVDNLIAEVISELPSAQKWIPCSERLPEKVGRYLTTCSKESVWTVDWNIWFNKPIPSWLWEQGVTAWMPLPEPYEGES